MLEEGQLLEVVYIRSKEDWPKVKGTYFCNRSGFNTVMEMDPDLPEKSFMREIRWYLQPIPIHVGNVLIPCKVCGKIFEDKEDLYFHYNQEHN